MQTLPKRQPYSLPYPAYDELLPRGELNVKDMITHRLDIREAQEGFRLMAEAGNSLKVILEPNRE
jgi:L-iditol 2-dehydrogenase